MARFGVVIIPTEEDTTPLPSIVNGNGTCTIRYLNKIRAASVAELKAVATQLDSDLGLVSEISSKRSATARDKCVRPDTLKKYPWFRLCHLRDYLRFRTSLRSTGDFFAVLNFFVHLQARGAISIVKIDVDKLRRPTPFGWRMIATDIRIPSSGLLVEHYMAFEDMIGVNEEWLHKVYEKWRSRPAPVTVAEASERNRDTEFSSSSYRELLLAAIVASPPGAAVLADRRLANEDAILNLLLSRF